VRLVVWAEAAVVGAALYGFSSRVLHTFADSAVFFEAFVAFIIRPVHVFEVSVFWAVFDE